MSVPYNGFDSEVGDQIQELARQFTNTSQRTRDTNNLDDLDEANTIASSIAPGISPICNTELPPRLDPNSDQFDSRYWIKNFRAFQNKDPDYYKTFSLGVTYKNLRAYGKATDADYQSTVLNAPLKYSGFAIKNLFYSKESKKAEEFNILKPMDAIINPGELVVVLGRPGSGCSTLLKTIATNTHGFHIDKESIISYQGLSAKDIRNHYRGEIVYNAESDIHFPHLTVWQTLSLAAKFRTPQNRMEGITREQYANTLTDVYMATYGLLHTKNTKVGNELVRGVSGGERKRVSIAEVSLSGAKVQCWDNATRGLDAATALEFIHALRTSADALDTTAVIAIYQCSQDAYDQFDKVSVLYEGYQIFFGPTDKAKDYFIRMGWDCPARQTTADFVTSVTSPRERVARKGFEGKVPKTAAEFEAYWKASPEYENLISEIDYSLKHQSVNQRVREAHAANQAKHTRVESPYTVSFWMQTRYCTVREFQRMVNDIGFHIFQVVSNSLMGLILSSIFYNLPKTTGSFRIRGSALFFAVLFNGFQSFLEIIPLFESRPIIEKHKEYALYHPSAASLGSVISAVPSKLLIAIFFNLVYYFMINLRREVGRFFFYLLVSVTATFTMSHFFRLIGSASPSLVAAVAPAQIVLMGLSIFVGFIVPSHYMLGWSKWIKYINPLAYAFEALMVNEFDGVQYECSEFIPTSPVANPLLPDYAFSCNVVSAMPGQTIINGSDYVRTAYGYHNKNKWRDFGITLAFCFFLLLVYLLFAEFNESAKQKGEILLFQRSELKKLKKEHDSIKNDLEAGNTANDIDEKDVSIEGGKSIFHWRDVHYTIKIKSEYREILKGVDGWVKPGTLTALMGATGAGKTTLLDVLANRVTMGVVTGNMFVNGHLRDSSFQRSTGYVQQQDLHLETATVREALKFSAYLRQPFHVSKKEKDDYVDEVIRVLDMEKYANAVIGVAGEGLNVEQRKRLTIGVELAAKPKLLLFLDEPTSGLDSQTAWSICQLMRKLANHGQAILCTIHQPSAILMQEFDRLLFLAKGGRTVYFGELGDHCQTLIDYFENHGAPKCPLDANPVEWMLHVIGAAPGSHANQDYYEVWMKSNERQDVINELEKMESELVNVPVEDSVGLKEFAAPLWYQYTVVTNRVFQQYWRTPSFLWSKMLLASSSSLFIGFTFFNAKTTIQGMQNQMFALFMFTVIFNALIDQILPAFVKARDLYETRERPSKIFSWKVFFTSQITVEIPWNFITGTLAFFTFYYPAGFYHNATATHQVNQRGAYAWLFSVIFCIFIGTTADLVIAPFQLDQTAGDVALLMFTMSLGFCGVLVQYDKLPGFWKFMYRVSPFTYFVNGFLSNALENTSVHCADNELVRLSPPPGETCGQYLEPFIQAIGTGYLVDADATSGCLLCTVSETNAFLASIGLDPSKKWRDFGIFTAYIGFDIIGALFLYWLVRVPKKKDRVKSAADVPKDQLGNSSTDEKE